MNILVQYLYRDAGNNKIWGHVVFSNRMNFDISELDKNIKNALLDGEFFIAEDVRLPSLHFDRYDAELDHGWHEYFSIENTENSPNDDSERDVCDFLSMLSLSKLRSSYYWRKAALSIQDSGNAI